MKVGKKKVCNISQFKFDNLSIDAHKILQKFSFSLIYLESPVIKLQKSSMQILLENLEKNNKNANRCFSESQKP